MTIQRYYTYYMNDFGDEYDAFRMERDDGRWVTYEDHAAALAAVEAELESWKSAVVAAEHGKHAVETERDAALAREAKLMELARDALDAFEDGDGQGGVRWLKELLAAASETKEPGR